VGASDGASSAAFLIELARVLKDQPKGIHLRIRLVRR
jgi:Zn-dependent M28 family amino/carboxypeptidase